MLKRYGVPFFNNSGWSIESQILFNSIYEKISDEDKNKTYYETLNAEFVITYDNKHFKYDFVNSKLKKAIEYNGQAWHPTPDLKNEDVGWHVINKQKTAKEAR